MRRSLVILLLAALAAAAQTREPLGRAAPQAVDLVTPNARHRVTIARSAGQDQVHVDQQLTGSYARVVGPVASADGQHLAYVGFTADQHAVVVHDGTPSEPYDYVEGRELVFSPDGQRIAWLARRGTDTLVALDGRAGPPVRAARALTFSPNSQRFAYLATERTGDEVRAFAVLDGQRGPAFDQLSAQPFRFSPDSRSVAYHVTQDGRPLLIVGDQQYPVTDQHGALVFSPDSSKVALVLVNEEVKSAVWLNGEFGPAYQAVGTPVFSADNQHLAYTARDADRSFVVADGTPGAGFDYVFPTLLLSATGEPVYAARTGQQVATIVGRAAGPPCDEVWGLTLLADGGAAYLARVGESVFVVSQHGAEYRRWALPLAAGDDAALTADGAHLVTWHAIRDRESAVALDGRPLGSWSYLLTSAGLYGVEPRAWWIAAGKLVFAGVTPDGEVERVTTPLPAAGAWQTTLTEIDSTGQPVTTKPPAQAPTVKPPEPKPKPTRRLPVD